jgi:hypothetical protein
MCLKKAYYTWARAHEQQCLEGGLRGAGEGEGGGSEGGREGGGRGRREGAQGLPLYFNAHVEREIECVLYRMYSL